MQVTEDLIRVPKEFLKLNKDLFLTMDIFREEDTIIYHTEPQD